MLRNHFLGLIFLLLLFLILGCQQSSSPIAPDNPLSGAGQTDLEAKAGMWSGGHHLVALVEVQINVAEKTVEVVDLRTAYQHLNLLQLVPVFCKPVSSCLDFINLVIDEPTATCELDVKVTHPILDPYTDVYDMRGIGIFRSTLDPGFTDGKVATQILNADGWTTAYDVGGEFDAALNPYIAFNTDLPRRIFAHGTTTIEHIICRFPSLLPPNAKFQYALDASWADPNKIDPDDPLTHPNLPEPYQVNILYADTVPNLFLAEGTVVVELFDWQKNAGGAELECPNLYGGVVEMTKVYSEGGRYLYYGNVVNDVEPNAGTYPLLIKAKDQYPSQPDLLNPTITVKLTNYQLGNITVVPASENLRPTCSVIVSDLNVVTGQPVHFDATGSSDPEDGVPPTIAWDLDGDWVFDDENSFEFDYQFMEEGTYVVNAMVTDSGSLTDILDLPIVIHVTLKPNLPPVASAFASTYNPYMGQIVTLDASGSTDPEDGKPVSWLWDLDGNGTYGDKSGEVIQHSWSEPGTYQVDVKVTDSGGLSDTLDSKLVIQVSSTPNQPPTACATADKMSAAVGETIIFDGTCSSDPEDGEIYIFAWDLLGKGTYDSGFSGIIPYKYWAPGTYLVDLRVTDSGGLSDFLDEPLEIEITGPPNQPPVAKAHASSYFVYPLDPITFDATESYDPEEGSVSIYAWDLNGDDMYTDAFTGIVDWFYTIPGTYKVDVRVTDTPGLSDTLDTPLTIQVLKPGNTPPVAVAHASKIYGYEGDTIYFDGSGSYDKEDGAPASWGWEFDGDNDYNDSPFIVAQYTYNTQGIYTVDLKVTDKDGAFDTLDVPITITIVPVGTNFPPIADASVNCSFPLVNQPIHFTDLSSDLDGTIVKWEWDFGDETGWHDFTSTQGNASYAYSEEGVYQAKLRVTDDLDAVDEIDSPITIFVSLPNFTPPGGQAQCPLGATTHFYGASFSLSTPNTTHTSRDLAFLSDGSYLMVVADALYRVLVPAILVEPPLMYSASWIRSIDTTTTGIVALSNLDDGIVKVYSIELGQNAILHLVTTVNVGTPIDAICFGDKSDLCVLSGGELIIYSSPSFQFNPCKVFPVPEVNSYGVPQEMEFNPWNHSLYVVVNDGGGGTVVEIDYMGNVKSSVSDVLPGPSHYMDIIIDKDVLDSESPQCRIEVFGGINQGYVTRLNADLDIVSQFTYGFWGIRAAGLNTMPSNEIIVLEDCCVSWLDLLIPPHDWSDIGKGE